MEKIVESLAIALVKTLKERYTLSSEQKANLKQAMAENQAFLNMEQAEINEENTEYAMEEAEGEAQDAAYQAMEEAEEESEEEFDEMAEESGWGRSGGGGASPVDCNLPTRTISVAGKTFSLEALLEGLKDPLVASQIGLNTAGNLATLGTEIAKNNSDGLSITGTALGFAGWAALLAHAAKEPVGFEEANCPEYCQNKCKQTFWQKILGVFTFGAESEAACLTACLADCN